MEKKELSFIGSGSAFNTKLGNNGAYLKEGNTLFMIDCGSSTFHRILENGLLEGIEEICVLLTHTHSDHIGSLGDLILYGFYSLGELAKPNVTVISPHQLNIKQILKFMGVEENTYTLVEFNKFSYFENKDLNIDFRAIPVKHVDELNCFGYIIYYGGSTIYYSGDCYEIPDILVEELKSKRIDIFYQDTCKADYDGNVHLSLRKLDEVIPKDNNVREKIFCMHLDGGFDKEEAESLGFKVVKNS